MCVEFSVNVTTLQNKTKKYPGNQYATVKVRHHLKTGQLQIILCF